MASPVEPLTLEYGANSSSDILESPDGQECLMCKERFNLSSGLIDYFLHHLMETHSMVIADAEKIACMKRYVEYWRPRLAEVALEQVCVKMEDKVEGGVNNYYMLCPVLPEDKRLRSKLQHDRLQRVLLIQQAEREDNSKTRKCLFCYETFTGNRSLVLNHMNIEHNFNIGHPDNLVNVDSFLAKLQVNLDKLLCFYCERTFKDRSTLKEHMRKKFHKKLNPKNKDYDQYYLVNYLELGKDCSSKYTKTITRRGKGGVVAYVTAAEAESDTEESWLEGEDSAAAMESRFQCLFCRRTSDVCADIFKHMAETHQFDFNSLKQEFRLNFYHQVKIINYVRLQMLQKQCVSCLNKFDDDQILLDHMVQSEHITRFVEDTSSWDQPEYFFPTYENDNLLSGLDCEEESLICDDWVIPEDTPSIESKHSEHLAPLLQCLTFSVDGGDVDGETNVRNPAIETASLT